MVFGKILVHGWIWFSTEGCCSKVAKNCLQVVALLSSNVGNFPGFFGKIFHRKSVDTFSSLKNVQFMQKKNVSSHRTEILEKEYEMSFAFFNNRPHIPENMLNRENIYVFTFSIKMLKVSQYFVGKNSNSTHF